MDINYDTITSTINQNTNWYFRRKSVFEESIKVEYYVNDHKLKEVMQRFFIKNQESSLKIHQFKLIFKLFACIFYVLRIYYDDQDNDKLDESELICMKTLDGKGLNWCAIFWVDRNQSIWLLQSLIAVCCLIVATIHPYLQYNGNIRRIIFNSTFIIELLCNFPFVVTLLKPSLNSLFIPSFLNCWLAKQTLDDIYCERNRVRQSTSALSHRLMTLSATLVCLIFTSVCGFQHFQRAGGQHVNLLESLYFVIVTFSTVGYGDYKPDNVISQVFVVFMICVSIIVLPSQFEQLIYTYKERKKLGQNFHLNLNKYDKHVVVCSTTLDADMILDFLNEFYAHPLLQDFYTILFSPCELDYTMKTILQSPIWAQRVIYIRGSVLKDVDMRRASIQEAEACFILAVRNCDNYDNADEHNILRSFAIRDFAPDVPQYVQIFRAKNKMHVAFAEQVVCEDEFKYALLAANCLNPGTSTLITLLIHTSRGEEGQTSEEEWHQQYGKSSGNEIYHVQLKDSRFFGEYEGKSFTYAAFNSHKKYSVTLIGVQTLLKGLLQIILNPGPAYILKETDICFYVNVNEEKNAAFLTTMVPSERTEWTHHRASSGQSPVERYANRTTANKRSSRFSISGFQRTTNRFLNKGNNLFNRSISESDTYNSQTNNNNVFIISDELNNNLFKNSNYNGITNPAMEAICSKSGRPQSECVQCTCRGPSNQQTINSNQTLNTLNTHQSARFLEIPTTFTKRNRHLSIDRVPELLNEHNLKEIKFENKDSRPNANMYLQGEPIEIVKDYPPEIPYVGVSPIRCYITKEKRAHCCLILDKKCKHTSNTQAEHYKWSNKSIILGAQSSSNGIYNFVLRLRAHIEDRDRLRPIILLLEKRPNVCFLDAISWFPLVYWSKGCIDNLDNLLIAGIHKSDSVVVVNDESTNSLFSIHLADCNTIIAVQSMFKMFPNVRIMSELSQSSNMRFMQFRAHDIYALSCSKREKIEQEHGSHIAYMFRLPFAAGSVFSASMLDTLLYQSFVKEYMISIVRHLLGIDQTNNSGYLSCKKITKEDLWIRTYQRLFQKLATSTYEIPIGIYRTQKCPTKQLSRQPNPIIDRDYVSQNQQVSVEIERQEIAHLVRNRMQNFGIKPPPENEGDINANNCDQLSYVIINPEKDLLLEEGDIIYIIKQANIEF